VEDIHNIKENGGNKMKASTFYSVYADLPLKKRNLNSGLTWNEVFNLMEEK